MLHVMYLILILTGKGTESLIPRLFPGLWCPLGQPQFGVIWNSVHFSVIPWPGHNGLYLDHYVVYPDLLPGPSTTTRLVMYHLPPLRAACLPDFEPNLRNLLLFLPHTSRHTCVCAHGTTPTPTPHTHNPQHPQPVTPTYTHPQHAHTHKTHKPQHPFTIYTHNTHTSTTHTHNPQPTAHTQHTSTHHLSLRTLGW